MKSLPVFILILAITATCFFEHLIKSAPALDKLTVGGIYAPSGDHSFEPYSYQGVSYTQHCRVLLNISTYPELTTGIRREKVCVFKTRSELIHLLAINEEPNILIISHGHDRYDGKWLLNVEGPDIEVDELPFYHGGIIGVNACRTQIESSYSFTNTNPEGVSVNEEMKSSDDYEDEGVWYHTRFTHLTTIVAYEPNFRIYSYTPFGHTLASDNMSPVITLGYFFK